MITASTVNLNSLKYYLDFDGKKNKSRAFQIDDWCKYRDWYRRGDTLDKTS